MTDKQLHGFYNHNILLHNIVLAAMTVAVIQFGDMFEFSS